MIMHLFYNTNYMTVFVLNLDLGSNELVTQKYVKIDNFSL